MLKTITTTYSEDEITVLIENAVNKVFGNLPETSTSEIISRDELCKKLSITEPTAIRWEKKGVLPCFRIGSNVRYNWPKVIEALENKKGVKK